MLGVSLKTKTRKARGGARTRDTLARLKRSKNGQGILIHKFTKAWGGVTRLSKIISKLFNLPETSNPLQNFVNWRTRGGVPLKFVFRLAKEFNISPYALNYTEVCCVLGPKSWESVVGECDFLSKGEKEEILSYKAPVSEC